MENRRILPLKDVSLDLSARTHLMGILNVTPDSFSDGGRFMGGGAPDYGRAVEAALRMAEDGADIIDIGGESTRPGSEAVSAEEEIRRVLPVIEGVRKRSLVPLSIDTYKASVAKAAVEAGCSVINDISGAAFDEGMLAVAAESGAAIVLMHIKGTPRDMQQDPRYGDVVAEVREYLEDRAGAAVYAGVASDRILVDPGIGFGKTLEHNLALIRGLDDLASLGCPVVLGVSRKAFIGKLTHGVPASGRVEGTIAACVAGILMGADILRVHDVKEVKKAVLVADAILRGVSS